MARKDQNASKRDRCDICGTALDDDAVIQEFPDGSVVSLCTDCATGAGPEDELEPEEDVEGDDATVEWSEPHDDPTAPAPSQFEAEIFESEDYEPPVPPPVPPPAFDVPESEDGDAGVTDAEAQLAAWASAPSDDQRETDLDEDYDEEYDEQEAEEAALQLVAAIAEADMADEAGETPSPTDVGEEAEPAHEAPADLVAEPAPTTEAGAAAAEALDRSQELLAPISELLELQSEMQLALSKLTTTLEHFVTDMGVSPDSAAAVDEKVHQLEDELESTRERLRVAESLLPESAIDAAAALAAATATTDKDLVSGPQAAAKLPADGQTTMPPPPPLPVPQTDSAKDEKKASAAVPPPLGEGIASGGAPTPPPLPGLAKAGTAAAGAAASGAAKAATAKAGAALGAAAGAAAAAAAIVPPSGGGAAAPKTAAPPSLPDKSEPKPSTTASESEPEDLSSTPRQRPSDQPDEARKRKKAGAAASSAASRSTEPEAATPKEKLPDGTNVEDMGLPPGLSESAPPESAPPESAPPESAATEPTPPVPPIQGAATNAVAGAAAAMHKLLRGRKAQPQPEPEPEPEPQPAEVPGLTFKINEVQAAQRYFNQSEFVKKLGEISRSIGKPRANVSRTSPGAAEAAVTVFWDIVWYQYIIDLRSELPDDQERVWLEQEGMDTEELEARFAEKNATINDDGRLDASELEVRLLSDPEALISNPEVSTPETRLAEDATEEIWDQQSPPEFRWD